jgi:hypothetical protein
LTTFFTTCFLVAFLGAFLATRFFAAGMICVRRFV